VIEPKKETGWDTLHGYELPDDAVLDFIRSCPTCVLVRNRKDGHPIGHVVGHGVVDGEIYTVTNTFRATHAALLRDPRCSVVFDTPEVGTVTVIGRAEIVDEDQVILKRLLADTAPEAEIVKSGSVSLEKFMEMMVTSNRRLVHVIPEKFISLDLRRIAKE
jgi:Pyridoxamine 5'-phosphate oxidase